MSNHQTEPNQGATYAGGALAGLRVLDMTSVIMGPYATQILADYGADVIKIESPLGDTTRQVPPKRNVNMSALFLHLNRNKRSVVLDLKAQECREAFFKLIETADALMTNVRPAALARLGITYESLKQRNPRLIWISLVGFGSKGPYAGRPAYDDMLQGLTGMAATMARAGADKPLYIPLSYNDRAAGLHGALALLAAVHWRSLHGEGQFVEVPMFETMIQFALGEHLSGGSFDPPEGPMGHRRSLTPGRRPYATKDSHICLVIYTDGHWKSFLSATGQEDRIENDPRVQSLDSRAQHAHELFEELEALMKEKTTEEWLQILERADVPAGPVYTLEEVLDDPHLQAVDMFQMVEHPTEGAFRQIRVPTEWSASPPTVYRHAPALGEHTEEVLRDAGVSGPLLHEVLGRRSN